MITINLTPLDKIPDEFVDIKFEVTNSDNIVESMVVNVGSFLMVWNGVGRNKITTIKIMRQFVRKPDDSVYGLRLCKLIVEWFEEHYPQNSPF